MKLGKASEYIVKVDYDVEETPPRFESVNLKGLANIPFTKIGSLYPEELLWGLWYYGKGWRCESDLTGCKEGTLTTDEGIPFQIDENYVTAVRKKRIQSKKAWESHVLLNDRDLVADMPEMLSIAVDKPAEGVYLLMSGLCSPMTCHLPQVEIKLIYMDGTEIEYKLTSPYEFDFISQHTSPYPAVHIGWFGSDEGLTRIKNDVEGPRCIINTGDLLNPSLALQQLHADVICLKGTKGILKEITLKPLKSQSGVILYGITLAID
jgi:hypothetical protein